MKRRHDVFVNSAAITALLVDASYIDLTTCPPQWTRAGMRSMRRNADLSGVVIEAVGWLQHRRPEDIGFTFTQRGLSPFAISQGRTIG